MTKRAIKKRATASVCALYLPNSGNKVEDLHETFKPAKPDAMSRALLEPNRKAMAF